MGNYLSPGKIIEWLQSAAKKIEAFYKTIDWSNMQTKISLYILAAALGLLSIIIIISSCQSGTIWKSRLRRKIKRQDLWEHNTFLGLCSRREKLSHGKKADEPGCYIITTYKRKLPECGGKRYFKKFASVYVGQSVNVYSRVKSHLTGHGNGDVYTDVRNGEMFIYVRLIFCPIKKLNKTEKELIRFFDATNRGYNKTKGGSPVLKRKN